MYVKCYTVCLHIKHKYIVVMGFVSDKICHVSCISELHTSSKFTYIMVVLLLIVNEVRGHWREYMLKHGGWRGVR